MQNLILDWLPPPHVASQVDQSVKLVQTPFAELERNYQDMRLLYLSYDVASRSEITPCNKIDKPLVVYIFLGNVMPSITTLRT